MESAEQLLAAAIENYRQERYREAEVICRQLTAGPVLNGRSCFLLGLVLGKTQRWPEARQWLRQAAELDPEAPEVWSELGRACNALGEYARAAECFRRFVELRPQDADGYFCLGNACQRLGQYENAVALYHKTVALNPADDAAWNNLGKALTEMNRLTDAVAAFDRAVCLRPDSTLARRNRAIAQLKAGRWQEGWRDYESRLAVLTPRPYPQPKWNGESLPGKTLFIHAEQGLGDSLQFVRFVSLARPRAGRVVLECQKPLQRLFQSNGIADEVIAVGEKPPSFEAYAALASLPRIFQVTTEKMPGAVPYLKAPAVKAAELDLGRKFKIGLAWAGNPEHERDAERSIPLTEFKPILDLENIAFFSFQAGVSLRDRRLDFKIADLSGALNDFFDTAAWVQQMDLIISVDTAMAHLAGALGKPTWILLPFVPDWRWLLARADTPWYPTMRLFRQERRGDWQPVILRVRDELNSESIRCIPAGF